MIGRNEGARLVRCLRSTSAASSEVVYVDSGSTDDSVVQAERLGAWTILLKMDRPFTAARARNEGFAALSDRTSVRFVQFVDGDCELISGWLNAARSLLERRKDVAIVFGRLRERHPELSIYNQLCDIEWGGAPGQVDTCGGIFMVRSEAFRSVSGFRSELIAGEEPELCVRLREKGWKIWRLEVDMAWHDAAIFRFGQWWRRAMRGGHAYAEVWALHRRSPLGIYHKPVLRAVTWAGLLPLLVCLIATIQPLALLGLLVYPLNIVRIAVLRGVARRGSWMYALLMTVGKFAETLGILKFAWNKARGGRAQLIEYK
ncbi:glycosyltransferase [Bradyrhizobium guangdongense]|uniref:glycosyltransferase n=1 Tax=Bradyrhizobium guangdongense TaxID=1325090 RepID=UPI001FEEDD0B|nr:glycosyltransferase [Bradyrhizobium guangdongense]